MAHVKKNILYFEVFIFSQLVACKIWFLSFQLGNHTCQHVDLYRNLSLGLVTKARAYKGTGQEGSPRVTFHAPRNVGEYERMNPHTPK
jgi:hypothetical protein